MNGDINNTNVNNGGQATILPQVPVATSTPGVIPGTQQVASSSVVTQQAPTVSSQSTSSANASQVKCDKCGEYYSNNQRYCMKCGALNYGHPSNQTMKQYINYDVVNHNYVENYGSRLGRGIIDPFIQKKRNCLVGSIILSIFSLIPVMLPLFLYLMLGGKINLFIISVYLIWYFVSFLFNYSFSLIYLRANENWWAHYIPFYNIFIFFKITLDNGWFMLLTLIPVINIIVFLYALYKLGTRFGRNGWLTLFLSLVMIPVIGLSNNTYAGSLKSMHMSLGANEVDSKGRTASEREYHVKKNFIIVGVLIASAIIFVFAFPYIKKYAPFVIDFFVDKYHEFMEVIEKMN